MAIDTQKKRSASLLVTDPLWPDGDLANVYDRYQMLDQYPYSQSVIDSDPGGVHNASDKGDVIKFGFRGVFTGKW